jgi:hypothetical protein
VNNGAKIDITKNGRYKYKKEIFEVGDQYELFVESPSEVCRIENKSGWINSTTVGEVNLFCYDAAELVNAVYALL